MKRGHIHYAHPAHQRLVKAVDWYDESGRLRVTDRYNNKNFRSLKQLTIKQKRPLPSYSSDSKEVIVINHFDQRRYLELKTRSTFSKTVGVCSLLS